MLNDESEMQTFEHELELLGSLKHPNIVSFYGACVKQPRIGIVTEFCDNGSGSDYIELNVGRISWEQKISILLNTGKHMSY